MAESGPLFRPISDDLNVRFREKRTLSLKLRKNERRTAALRSKADIKLELAKESANDPMVFPRFSGQLSLVLMSLFRTRPD